MQDTAGHDRKVENLFSAGRRDRDRVIVDLLGYWESLRAGRLAPARSEIDPRQIRSVLKHTFILEFDPIGGIRFRLAGDKVCALMGMELRGLPAYALIDVADRRAFEATLHALTDPPEIVEYRLTSAGLTGGAARARMLLLPMQDADGEITRVLGGLSVQTPLFEPPLRFQLAGKMRTRIVAGTGLSTLPTDRGFAEDAQVFKVRGPVADQPPRPDPTDYPGAPRLKIVSNNYGRKCE